LTVTRASLRSNHPIMVGQWEIAGFHADPSHPIGVGTPGVALGDL
jgi:hypothetical protein